MGNGSSPRHVLPKSKRNPIAIGELSPSPRLGCSVPTTQFRVLNYSRISINNGGASPSIAGDGNVCAYGILPDSRAASPRASAVPEPVNLNNTRVGALLKVAAQDGCGIHSRFGRGYGWGGLRKSKDGRVSSSNGKKRTNRDLQSELIQIELVCCLDFWTGCILLKDWSFSRLLYCLDDISNAWPTSRHSLGMDKTIWPLLPQARVVLLLCIMHSSQPASRKLMIIHSLNYGDKHLDIFVALLPKDERLQVNYNGRQRRSQYFGYFRT